MNHDALKAEICRIMEIQKMPDDLKLDDIDSLSRIEIVVWVEEKLKIELLDKEIKLLKTYRDLEVLIESKCHD